MKVSRWFVYLGLIDTDLYFTGWRLNIGHGGTTTYLHDTFSKNPSLIRLKTMQPETTYEEEHDDSEAKDRDRRSDVLENKAYEKR